MSVPFLGTGELTTGTGKRDRPGGREGLKLICALLQQAELAAILVSVSSENLSQFQFIYLPQNSLKTHYTMISGEEAH